MGILLITAFLIIITVFALVYSWADFLSVKLRRWLAVSGLILLVISIILAIYIFQHPY
jgi:uncharacterized membrane protein